MKKKLAFILASVLLGTTLCAFPVMAESYDVDNTYTITGYDEKTSSGCVIVYPNNTNSTRVIGSSEYNFRYSKVLIFDKNGALIEAGGDLLANENGINGSPQLTVKVPAGGFLVAYNSGAPAGLSKCFETAMEGAMLYNATMSVIYPVHGEYNKTTNKLRIAYNNPVAPSKDAIKFLFVGNSTTYFNGIPIKFKGLCQAAGVEVVVDYCTNGSAFLHEFADSTHERGKKFRNMLNAKEYDYVVLQDAAGAAYNDMDESVGIMLPLIEKNGATPLLYMRYSDDIDAATRVNSFYKHYRNYSRLSDKYGIEYSPVASAFLKCIETNPEINLFADDGGHHSWEGSYLAACTWLYSYLGIDPRGNSYTANLPSATATALQNIAYDIAKNGYPYPEADSANKVIDGVKYENLSLKKPYVSSGDTYGGDWTDTGSDGKPLGKYTDGYSALTAAGNVGECGCYKGENVTVTIDLGALSSVKQVTTDMFGNSGWGIPSPKTASVKVAFSSDGKTFTESKALTAGDITTSESWERRDFTVTFGEMVEARYVRVEYTISGKFLWVSEISVFGKTAESGDTDVSDPDTDVSVPETSVPETSVPEVSDEEVSEPETSVPDESVDTNESVADEESKAETNISADASSESSDTSVSGSGKKGGQTAWIIAAVGAVVAAVAVAAVVILKKKK